MLPNQLMSQGRGPSVQEMKDVARLFAAARYEEALDVASKLCERFPHHGFGWKVKGAALMQMGRVEAALPCMKKAVQISPNDAEAHSNLAATLLALRQLDAAAQSYRQALKINPNQAVVSCNLGTIQRELKLFKASEESYRHAIRIDPAYADAHCNLGNVLFDLGRLHEAEASYRRSLELRPNDADSFTNLGALLRETGRAEEAAESFGYAAALAPNNAQVHANLGVALMDIGQLDQGRLCLRTALELEPESATLHFYMATALQNLGRYFEAKTSFQTAAKLGHAMARQSEGLMLPMVMGTKDQVLTSRRDFEVALDQLMSNCVNIEDPLKAGASPNFYLAYHGLNDRDLQVKVATYYAQACPSLLYTSPHCRKKKPASENRKIRIGFISRYLSKHSVSFSFSKILEVVASREQFEVSLISSHAIDENIYAGANATRTRLPHNLALAREAVAALELDVLVYLDIGMEPQSYFMAFARLAPVQCVLGGHPVTTGIANMDYYLSSELMESENAQEHYSEKLIRFPSPVYYFARPSLPERLKTREELGLPKAGHIYMCPMRLQKMHPDFDVAMAKLLELDPTGTIVLFDDKYLPLGKQFLLERFEKTIPQGLRERILFLPWVTDPADFISTIAAADVVLDPYHFGIGTTAIMTFVTGTPLVTRPAEFMRGRVGAAMCKMLDMEECIAEDTQEYVSKAYELACDRQVRERVSEQIMKNSSIFFDNLQPIEHLVDFLSACRLGK